MRMEIGRLGAYCAVLLAIVMLSACGGSNGHGTTSQILRISVQATDQTLWPATAGMPCVSNLPLTTAFALDFSDAVDASSLPAIHAAGPVSITPAQAASGAVLGTFHVVDDPSRPPGNRARVIFAPRYPSTPSNVCSGGLTGGTTYDISVPSGLNGNAVVTVSGRPLENSAQACFTTCPCGVSGGPCNPITDPVPGDAHVIGTLPATSDPAPPAISACSIGNDVVVVLIDEPLDPATLTAASVRILDVATQAVIPGTLYLMQGDPFGGTASATRLEFTARHHLAAGRTFEIVIGPEVRDFGGNPIQTSVSGPPGAHLYFATSPGAPLAQAPITESFADTGGLATQSGNIAWDGSGTAHATLPTAVIGDGSDGAFVASANVTLDTGVPASRHGVFNFTTFTVAAGVTVRVVGPYPCHIRCQGDVSVDGILDVRAGTSASAPLGSPDQAAKAGLLNNGGGLGCVAAGGVGGAGGGAGGAGSPGTCNVRAATGENGYGPTIDGAPNPGVPGNATYAGGVGGDSGCFPVVSGCTLGDLGGLGGAGGTAATVGADGLPHVNSVACPLQTIPTQQPIAHASPVVASFIPPVSLLSAGSGGGGGGDHTETILTPPAADDQGGGGGGGGGGIRITSGGNFVQGGTGRILCSGGSGNIGAVFGGSGGSGSGGEIWIQALGSVSLATTAILDVDGPPRPAVGVNMFGCSNQASGDGGDGLVQIEYGAGTAPSGFVTNPPAASSLVVLSVPTAATVEGTAYSSFRHSGDSLPDYTGVLETVNLGTAPGAVVEITYEGAHEAITSSAAAPIADLTTLKSTATGGGPITASNIDELDGFAFIRFRVRIAYASPPATPASATLPSVDEVSILYATSIACP